VARPIAANSGTTASNSVTEPSRAASRTPSAVAPKMCATMIHHVDGRSTRTGSLSCVSMLAPEMRPDDRRSGDNSDGDGRACGGDDGDEPRPGHEPRPGGDDGDEPRFCGHDNDDGELRVCCGSSGDARRTGGDDGVEPRSGGDDGVEPRSGTGGGPLRPRREDESSLTIADLTTLRGSALLVLQHFPPPAGPTCWAGISVACVAGCGDEYPAAAQPRKYYRPRRRARG